MLTWRDLIQGTIALAALGGLLWGYLDTRDRQVAILTHLQDAQEQTLKRLDRVETDIGYLKTNIRFVTKH